MPEKLDINTTQLEELAQRFWKISEIAAFFGCSESTIKHRFAQNLVNGREKGKGTLRDWQLNAAKKGSAALLIWLGKQYLGQTEKIEVTNDKLVEEELEFNNVPKKMEGGGRFRRFYN